MLTRESRGSLRLLVIALIGGSVALLAALLFSIFFSTMPGMLLQVETRYLTTQRDVVDGLFAAARKRAYLLTEDTAVWDETVLFARGENDDYFEDNWPEKPMLESFRCNFVIIKDPQGRDLHVEFYDYFTGTKRPPPPGFSDRLTSLAGTVLAGYERNRAGGGIGMEGIILYEGVAYSVAAAPIIHSRATVSPAGVFMMGNILTNAYFRDITNQEHVAFALGPPAEAARAAGIDRQSADDVTISLRYADLDGKPLQLRMSAPRTIYLEGRATLGRAQIMLFGSIALFGLALYLVVARFMLNPVERLSRDIGSVSADDACGEVAFNPQKYSRSREFVALCGAINDILRKVNQSKISMDVLRRILNGIDAFMYVTDPDDDTILFINDTMAEHFGLDAADVVGKVCWRLLQRGAASRCGFCPVPRLFLEPGKAIVWEETNAVTGRHYRNTDTLIHWVDGKMVHLQHSVDVTQAKRAESALERRLEQQELMSTISQSFISTEDRTTLIGRAFQLAGEFMDMGKILFARLDKDKQALVPEYEWYNPMKACPPQERTEVPFRPGFPEYEGFIVEKRQYMAIGDILPLKDYAYPVKHGIKALIGVPVYVNGEFWGMLSFNDCATTREWSESDIQLVRLLGGVISGVVERSLRDEELYRMSSIVESSPQYIAYVNEDGGFEYVNPGVSALTGYSEEELSAGGLRLIFDATAYDAVINTIIPIILARQRYDFELPLQCKNGQKRLMKFSGFLTASKAAVGIGAIAVDITAQRQMEQDILAARDAAERSNMAKSEFLSRMSHEMRTPMNAIIGMANIGRSSAEAERKQYCLEKINDASTHLLGVINDILDMSKIEANKFELSPTEFPFEKMLMRVLTVTNFRLEEKKQNLSVSIDPDMPYAVIADEQRLAQVVANLLSNAVKFTPEGGDINVVARLLEEQDDVCTLEVSVADTGIGISKQQQAKLFRSFEQADGGISRKYGGTGLGLAISKRIVEMMAGRIWVVSEEGKGSRFIFTVKVKRGSGTQKSLLSPDVKWENLRILAVDDAPEVREYFLATAEALGVDCTVAEDGYAACKAIEAHRSNPFNIMFIDWKMPGMDGIELARRIKALVGANAVVIMISAAEWNEIENEARAVGVKMFIPKPLFTSQIVDSINQCLGMGPAAVVDTCEEKIQPGCFSGRRLLLAEDVEINREIVASFLEETGIDIDAAENGREAVEKFTANPGAYDVIFMDIHMPEVDGYEATRQIRALGVPEARTVPIIAMTANVFREDIERCLEAGMDDHIGKPIDIDDLYAKLRKLNMAKL